MTTLQHHPHLGRLVWVHHARESRPQKTGGHQKKVPRLHPGRLTWNIIMEVGKMIFLSKWVISRFHVNLPGCKSFHRSWLSFHRSWCSFEMLFGGSMSFHHISSKITVGWVTPTPTEQDHRSSNLSVACGNRSVQVLDGSWRKPGQLLLRVGTKVRGLWIAAPHRFLFWLFAAPEKTSILKSTLCM